MSDLARHFLQELRALLDEGAEFAKNYPEAARCLDPNRADNNDPYVERLIEGCAFLTSRIREEAQDDFLYEQLLEQFAPDLSQSLPSITVVQFALRPEAARPVLLSRGTPIVSEPCEGMPAPFEYRLQRDVSVNWASVSEAQIDVDDQNRGHLLLSFRWDDIDPVLTWPADIPIFLHGDLPVVWSLRHALLRRISSIEVEKDGKWSPAPDVGFDRFDGISYTSESNFTSPLAAARDFFCADERFRFVRLTGLDTTQFSHLQFLRLRIHFQGTIPFSWTRSVGKDSFRLHAGTAVNRFHEPCEPVTLDHSREKYPLRSIGGWQREVLDVVSVRGVQCAGKASHSYGRYGDHRHHGGGWFFQVVGSHRKQGNRLSIAVGTNDIGAPMLDEYLSIEAVCCDGAHPHEHLRPESLNQIRSEQTELLQTEAITRPTKLYRPADESIHSRLLAFANCHNEGWLDAKRLKDGLRQVLWDPAETKLNLIDSIQDVVVDHGYTMAEGIGWRLMRVQIRLRDTTCTPETWDRLGLLDAFGSILWGIVQDATPIGSKGELEVLVDPAGVRMMWEG
jgi:type VI secretion system protein ImpG